MIHSRLEPVKEPARLIRRRFAEVVAYFVLLQCLFDRFGSVFP